MSTDGSSGYDYLNQKEDVKNFETGRIKALQEERLHIQKKTFTKWINSFLIKTRMEVEDIFTDLADGRKLLRLLEIISGEKLGKPNNGKMRVHKIENVNKSLAFLHTKVRLESIGAEDIVDGNPRLILGLIWTIILRFQIEVIDIDIDETDESSEKKSAKDALLLWCQRKTAGYNGVRISDFSSSWRNGLGFNALIHAHRPDLIDYKSLQPANHVANLNNAFEVAQKDLGIHRLLDAEDIDVNKPDEKSVMTYVASYYHTFAKMKSEIKGGKRIANLVGQMMEVDRSQERYNVLTTSLLEWILMKVSVLEDRDFPNSLEGIQKELLKFKSYRTEEKPPKFRERSEIEALYFDINTKLKALNKPAFSPPEGKLLHDIERTWTQLEKAEHSREVALRAELQRQERLEQLAYKFERKGVLREGYLKEMIQVLSDPRYGSNLTQVEATVKKHEAISADILARRERFADLVSMADELERENYHGAARVRAREQEVTERWQHLLSLLDRHKQTLANFSSLMTMLREIDTVLAAIKEMEGQVTSEAGASHLLAAEDLIQKHSLMESQISSVGETIQRLNKQANQFIAAGHRETPALQKRLQTLNDEYKHLVDESGRRSDRLDEWRSYLQFVQDCEDEEAWLVEKQRICTAGITAKDLRAVLAMQQKHKALEDELRVRRPKTEKIARAGEELEKADHPQKAEIRSRIDGLKQKFAELEELAAQRRRQLAEAAEAYQFYSDANEAESWLKEKRPLVSSTDCGTDEPGAASLLARHKDTVGEINAYQDDITALAAQADKLQKAGITSLSLSGAPEVAEVEEWTQETRLVPKEVWEDEPVERTEYRIVTEERQIPQVKALYPFQGQDMQVVKGEVMFLLNQTNDDWWNVRKASGQDGFVPANYVKEIEPKLVTMKVKKPEVVRDVKKVKKTKMVRQTVPVKRTRPAEPKEDQLISKRVESIQSAYAELGQLADRRRTLLQDAIRLFQFNRECNDFELWMREKEKFLKTEDPTQTVEAAKHAFEKFLTDMVAASKRIDTIDEMVSDFVKEKNTQIDKVKQRQRQIHQLWDHLNRLKQQKERSLEGASSVELFGRTCEEASDWMNEKMDKMENEYLGADLKTIQALQRRHDNLERELAPIEEKVKRVAALGNSVKASYPHELANVTSRQKEVNSLWDKVREKALQRRARLEDAVGTQIFINQAQNLLAWVDEVKANLNATAAASDVHTAETLLKTHQDLGDDIRAHQDEFAELTELGNKLLKKSGGESKPVRELSQRLSEEQRAVHRGWQEKDAWLHQLRDLQLFNREADQMDAITGGHQKFIELTDLGDSLDAVERLIKRHEDFENTLAAQDERLKAFSDTADRLVAAKHYDAENISARRDQVLARRQETRERAAERHQQLLAAQAYYEFRADCDELRDWMADKSRSAADDNYRDLSNLERKLQRHEAFERELRANEGRLRKLNKVGQELASRGHYQTPAIEATLSELNAAWEELCRLTAERGANLRQAAALHDHNRTLDGARAKLDELGRALQSKDLGNDLRSCKQQLKKHQALEVEVGMFEDKVNELVNAGQEMAQEGHFDAENILAQCNAVQARFGELKDPMAERRRALEEALRYHEFVAGLDAELQWIAEHQPAANSETLGQTLHEAQSLSKKHAKLEAELRGHKPVIEKAIQTGTALAAEKRPNKDEIVERCRQLQTAWDDLHSAAARRAGRLQLNLAAQRFFADADEVESWMAEKTNVLTGSDFGKDEDAAVKLLTKHKALELELDSYAGLVKEMSSVGDAMVKASHPDAKMIQQRQQLINQQLKDTQRLATQRRQRLMDSKHRHEYFRESDDLERWIAEQLQTAASEDYGTDFEHLLLLRNKFEDLKHRVEAGSERFNQCDELAKKLIANENPYAADMDRRQDQLRGQWVQLLEMMDAREEKLTAAGELHRFNRDVAEALQRIQEKYAQIPDDLGRSLQAVHALIRRHEGFENDLVALEAQLQVLVNDSARLQESYPTNAEHIADQQRLVVTSWDQLHQRAAQRKEELQASLELQRFLTQGRDLMTWSGDLRAGMMTEEAVRDAASAQALKTEHDRVKAEVEAREENFTGLVQMADAMIQDQHYAAQEVQERLEQVLEERKKLHAAWQQRKIYLDQLIDYHFFLRDAKNLDSASGQQEAALSKAEFGSTVDSVEAEVRRQEALDRLVGVQNDRLQQLSEHGSKLLQQNHFRSPEIKQRLDECVTRRKKVSDLAAERRRGLNDSLLHVQFLRDCMEAEMWIAEKKKALEAEKAGTDVTSLEEKIKKLQKHQTFEAELTANKPRIAEIKDKGDKLLQQKHLSSREIRQQLDALLASWQQLLAESASRGRGLEEAQDILDFNNQVEKVEAWIRDKDMLVQAAEMGRDYEHCQALQRRLDDVDSDMRVDDVRIKNMNALADKLIRQGQGDNRAVQQKRDELNQRWKSLQGALSSYREQLAAALEVHAFYRDLADTAERIQEKALSLSSEETGKDLGSVEALQRKQEAAERDMTAIDGKLKEHDAEARRLMQKYADRAAPIRARLQVVQDSWRRLQTSCENRRTLLASSYTLQKFHADRRELEAWVADMMSRMAASHDGGDAERAEELLQLHQERKAEMDGRQEAFKALKDFGHKLVQEQHYARDEVETSLAQLEELRRTLGASWEERRHQLTQAHQRQLFDRQAQQAHAWLAGKEAFLNNDDLGDSIASVEALMKKHKSFEKTFAAQASRVDELEQSAVQLVAAKHYDSEAIQETLQAVCQRRDRIKESSLVREQRLAESLQLQRFLRNIYESETWLGEKMQVACDESYRDPTNLQSKIQKHQAFEAELQANAGRVLAVNQEGEALMTAGHYAGMEIQARLDALEALWRQLQDETSLKKRRLQEAYQALLFHRTLDELDAWMDEVESQLASEDHGDSLTAAANLLKRHQLLEADINSHADAVQQAKETAAQFARSQHFQREEVAERANHVVKRFASLAEPMQIRRDNLEQATQLHQFIRDVDDELGWLAEKEPLVASEDLGSSLAQVQSLQKNHQALEAEIQSHEPVITALGSQAQQMMRANHFASAEVERRWRQLQDRHGHVRDAASVRRLRLLDAAESQQFYAEAEEADKWMRERKPLLTSSDTGKDRDAVTSLTKKLDLVERDINNYNQVIAKLSQLCQRLSDRAHFDTEQMRARQARLEEQYAELVGLLETRRLRLQQSGQLFRFLAEADEAAAWVSDQEQIAASEDYGRDVEHVELLINKFEQFLSGLQSSEERVTSVEESARQLVAGGHPQPERILQRAADLRQSWDELRELTQARQEALAGAKQVHVFDRDADETIAWIGEKEAAISTDDYGHDLDSIQALVRRHQGFERDLAAVKEQVEQVVAEAKRLASQFPDAREHISVKHEDTVQAWNDLLDKSAQRKDKLEQAANIQAYFDEYRDLMAWINELLAKITAPELARDVAGAEALLARHAEYQAELQTRQDAVDAFISRGQELISSGHFMSTDIQDKVNVLGARRDLLAQTWKDRQDIYEQSLDTQIFKRDAAQLESWLETREPVLNDPAVGASITEVEELIRRHDDFLKTIESQEDKFDALRRTTRLEEAFALMRRREEEARVAEQKRREEERLRQIRQQEVDRITKERRYLEVEHEAGDASPSAQRREAARAGASSSPHQSQESLNHQPTHRASFPDVAAERMLLKNPMLAEKKMGSQSSLSSLKRGDVKRAESMKTEPKKAKRTPSFTTRRRTQSFRKAKRLEELENLPPVEMDGMLERKQELQSGGKKATIRSWKHYYTVLCGQLLCFFKDMDDFANSKAAAPPLILYQARCERALNYTKKKHVFRLSPSDGSEFLFAVYNEEQLQEWINKIEFHAQLPPSQQLLSYDRQTGLPGGGADGGSSCSSAEPSPAPVRHRHSDPAEPVYANLPTPQQRRHTGQDPSLPPVPPRGASSSPPASRPPPSTAGAAEGPIYQNRVSVLPSIEVDVQERNGVRRHSSNARQSSQNEPSPPPLPSSAPPPSVAHRLQGGVSAVDGAGDVRQRSPHGDAGLPPGGGAPHYAGRTGSLPYGQQPSPSGSNKSATLDQRNGSESGSEHDQDRRSSKRSSVFGFLRRNKKDKQPAQV
ncbi:spectrin beta chain, non-erythrocytic 2-like isoform X8 [Amphibalanus amphitrite]|uniref:spectrin beta chain, non-erythrocytic 2-like isoform X8 n=1 Tax=Amphibalanus amphitrite TaxID=1232801 RepID=UPI001C90516C|nr:spectrin beta chain, non-erythrocytic 2-like isoform X8 [Amphibalanus amphitrite]